MTSEHNVLEKNLSRDLISVVLNYTNSYDELFIRGCKANDTDLMKYLLEGKKIDPSNPYYFKVAVENGNLDATLLLLKDNKIVPANIYNYSIRWRGTRNHYRAEYLILKMIHYPNKYPNKYPTNIWPLMEHQKYMNHYQYTYNIPIYPRRQLLSAYYITKNTYNKQAKIIEIKNPKIILLLLQNSKAYNSLSKKDKKKFSRLKIETIWPNNHNIQ